MYLPVESHLRELDGKILLAAAAAERGRPAILGFQTDLRRRMAGMPRGIYMAKSFGPPKPLANFLRMFRDLGHSVVGWDEEGLVHAGQSVYARRRASPRTLPVLSAIFSWGQDYTNLVTSLPYYHGTPLFETGNPRIDLLHPRVRGYFDAEAAKLRAAYGGYILINSNFGRVNPLIGNAFVAANDGSSAIKKPEAAPGELWSNMVAHRFALFEAFRNLLPALAARFPGRQIVLRPHPAERLDTWQDVAAGFANIHIIREGGVAPWILGAEVMIHNGCTTAIESALLDRPAVAYQPIRSQQNDWHLPNDVSHCADSEEHLFQMLENHLGGSDRLTVTDLQKERLSRHVFLADDQLAVDRILDVIDRHESSWDREPPALPRLASGLLTRLRAAEAGITGALIPRHMNSREVQDINFPPLPEAEMRQRLERFSKVTGRFSGVEVRAITDKIFAFSAAA
jgi:surface carbohydrate biosynthesis protein